MGSGNCGSNLSWTLDETGTLTITGTGAMTNYQMGSSKWSNVVVNSSNDGLKNATIHFSTDLGDEPVGSGTCGANITWTLDETGTLTITGTGAMTNYQMGSSNVSTPSPAPWLDYYASIKSVVISEGVTTIGAYAFYKCSKITTVSIPTTVTSIGDDAFYNCAEIISITLPSNLKTIGYEAFSGCTNLANCAIPSSVTSLGGYACLVYAEKHGKPTSYLEMRMNDCRSCF